MKKNITLKSILSKIFYIFFFAFFVGTIAFPFFWQFLNSFKTQRDLFSVPLNFWPTEWTFQNYVDVFSRQPFGRYILNSFIIAGISTLFAIILGALASYAVSRTKIKFKKLYLIILLSITLLPPITIVNPIYMIISKLGLLNTYWGLALVNTIITLPTAVWFLSGFFETIPHELEESAMIDGASVFQSFYKIVLPLVSPAIFTVSILVFIAAWNQYLFAQILNPLKVARTITVGITLYQTDYTIPWGTISAASIVVTVPLIILVLILQRKIISGLMDGGVKG
ncbi:carbohydrate ABC transporter permease [Oceanotoga sp. DSM 15011]|jgi:multiple sugar transport system permease protein|uniref:Carbohydrate ABC transporter membrane protein 2 (CUT1 family) n=1 Tax=Oceanotoga teriensis TaxID=515440 RepID=A0AA45C6J3_9BACT|nr:MULTISPECIES: carbohydrate ABC transporter permease [Oceanotoga]MDO7976634.1 carbohydrate ABC transporter permease [Oceanotoga teriensis]PWJ92129.1 carbohydrate ABC transporter membrane protein 2 (CUT1 family) [Oceanotoga teriensis]UYO99351.1 carbohydrate ABC transporter permease [Oceanotoga sp. DSM 15011]